MTTTIIYDRKSGNIIHIHRASGRRQRDILALVHPSQDRSHLATVEIAENDMPAGELFRIDPETQKPKSAKAGVNSSAGALRFTGAPLK